MIKPLCFLGALSAAIAAMIVPQQGDAPSGESASNEVHNTQGVPAARRTPVQSVPGLSEFSQEDLPGIVRPKRLADLPALIGGIIREVRVAEGQTVHEGELLIALDDDVPRARLKARTVEAELTGALRQARIQLRHAEQQLAGITEAVANGAGAEFELTAAEARRDQAQAAVQQQQDILSAAAAEKEVAQAQLDQYRIVAPFDGVVIEIRQSSGATDGSHPLITVASLEVLEVELQVPISRFGELKPGDIVSVRASKPVDRLLDARVMSVSPMIDSASCSYRCLLQLSNSDRSLPSGFSVTLAARALQVAGGLQETSTTSKDH